MKHIKSSFKPEAESLFDLEPTKAQLQQIKIVQAAIKSFAIEGLEKTNYTNLAKTCDISRPLIHHYFPTLDSLFDLTAKYVRQTLLECAKQGMALHPNDEKKQLEGYIAGCFKWVEVFPDQVKFWMLYFYQASLGSNAKKENTTLVRNGHLRIQSLILSGKEKGIFEFKDSLQTSKAIQLLITGAIVSVATEDDYLTLKNVTALVQQQALQLLKF